MTKTIKLISLNCKDGCLFSANKHVFMLLVLIITGIKFC